MKIKKVIFTFLLLTGLLFNLNAGERSMPVDMIIMIDKSLSMEDPGKFESLKQWVLDELVGQIIINGDWVSIYQFYESPEHLLSIEVKNNEDTNRIIKTINAIKPNGRFTDVGKALDKMQDAVGTRGENGRYKVLFMLTDLEQDAPITSKYSGKQKKFSSPYLVESRIIKHDNWYEITVDMGLQDRVVKTSKALFSDILKNKDKDRVHSDENQALIKKNQP
ncbi:MULTISPECIES: vWA domain-containing protein [unclassified Treponema]|uniref:vWA domain-containing protein n=1 Tax=unclassified Treponema TaxID=2638727 RepID=UPI0020A3AE31|nr:MULTISPECIES: vWA domain-containing protein [unclassified Treponema]UTC67354.1 VWA domain-containing protein [Treponema sp. OMZ 789]UTC70082.1 VWA domain-containing protein [Treponema sp. OMZ 790]UTC72798.1 VWA domain-containing protein [Treponema sp. OMZ 791]